MEKKELKRRVKELSEKEEWNHLYVFPHNVKTRDRYITSPGYNINKWERLEKIFDENLPLKDKTVLDIGCSDGYFSIECINKGARHVFGFDLDPLRIERAQFAKEVYGIDNVDFEVMDLYDLKKDQKFDIVIGLGLLHRIPDLEKCLEKLSEISTASILEFKTLDSEESKKEWQGGETKGNIYNKLYYIPTQKYVIEKMKDLGFPYHKVVSDEKSGLNYKRTILLSSKKDIFK